MFTIIPTAGITYQWTPNDLDFGRGGMITITGQLADNLSPGELITNTATITSSDGDSNPANNSASAGVEITCVDSYVVTNANNSGSGSLRFGIAITCPGGNNHLCQ